MSNEENKDLLETTIDEFFAKYPDCRNDREDRINSENIDLFCQWAMEGIELVEDQIGYFSSEEDEIFTENQKLHFNKSLNEKGNISQELKVNENQASFFDDGQIDFGADPEVTRKLTNYFNKKGKKLRKQKFKVATDDKIFFLK
ncbi:hypothetical protein [Pseudomonas lactis]|uniref:hypothetical protein n=1 Tax=Pseudomonas lactis TaxID=1615674 RepID=UPI003F7DC765